MFDLLVNGFATIAAPFNIFLMISGVTLGIIFGAIPGLNGVMAIALCLPLTFTMTAESGFTFLIALYIGGISGGLISAILINMPGTAASLATAFDGYPMAQQGKATKALGVGVVFSFLGTIFSVIILMFMAPPLAQVALKFSPFEYFSITFFSLTLIAGLSGKNMAKGLVAGFIGMALATVGIAPIDGYPRFTFGITMLEGGFSPLPALIGLFAVTEIMMSSKTILTSKKVEYDKGKIKGFGFSLAEFKSQIGNFFRSSIIGAIVGILPGVGGGTANILAYATAQKTSKHPEKFGTGIIDGLVASESSNNASIGGAMVPLLTLGLPGDGSTAMLLGGFILHGLTPGPLLFRNNAPLVYTIFAALIACSFIMLMVEFFGIKLFVRVLDIPKGILLPIIFILCAVGAFASNNRMFEVWTLLLFGVIGFALQSLNIPKAPIVLGFILGPMLEINLRRAYQMGRGSMLPLLTRPVSAVFVVLAVLVLVFSFKAQFKKKEILVEENVES